MHSIPAKPRLHRLHRLHRRRLVLMDGQYKTLPRLEAPETKLAICETVNEVLVALAASDAPLPSRS
jgi:hypothetical protein